MGIGIIHSDGYINDYSQFYRGMESSAYAEYQNIRNEGDGMNSLRYLTNWYANAVKKSPTMIEEYEKQSEEYIEKNEAYHEARKLLKAGMGAAPENDSGIYQSGFDMKA